AVEIRHTVMARRRDKQAVRAPIPCPFFGFGGDVTVDRERFLSLQLAAADADECPVHDRPYFAFASFSLKARSRRMILSMIAAALRTFSNASYRPFGSSCVLVRNL